MKHKKILQVLSVLLALFVCLPSFSLHSSAADVNASAYSVSAAATSYYFTDNIGIVEEVYSEESVSATYSDFPFDLNFDYSYPDSNRIATLLKMRVTFTDDLKYYGTNYRLSFNLDKPFAAHYIYFYGMTVPESYSHVDSSGYSTSGNMVVSLANFAITFPFSSIGVGDNAKNAGTFNNEIRGSLISTFGDQVFDYITTADGYYGSSKPFNVDLYIPADQAVLHRIEAQNGQFELTEPYPRAIEFYFLIFKQTDSVVDSLTLSDISLIPIKGTENYYQDEIFQNDVIGSDEEGEESGLKGIISYLKKLPEKIFQWFELAFLYIIGTDEEGVESGILGILAFIKKIPTLIMEKLKLYFVPGDDFLTKTVDDMDLFMSEHLGVFYQAPKILVDLIRYFVDLDIPFFENAGDYKLCMPNVTLYINSEPPPGYDYIYSNLANDYQVVQKDLSSYIKFEILPDNSIGDEEAGYYLRLEFLEKRPYSSLYNVYRVFSFCFVIVIFLLYCYRRLNAVLGGLNE